MAEKKQAKKESKQETKVKKADFSGMDLSEARKELQKVLLDVKTSQDTDTSKVRKIKTHIARLLTKERMSA